MADLVRLGTGSTSSRSPLFKHSDKPSATTMLNARFHRPLAVSFLTASPGILPTGTVTSVEGLEQVRAPQASSKRYVHPDQEKPSGPSRSTRPRRARLRHRDRRRSTPSSRAGATRDPPLTNRGRPVTRRGNLTIERRFAKLVRGVRIKKGSPDGLMSMARPPATRSK